MSSNGPFFKVSWRDSVGLPSYIHAMEKGRKDTCCGGHDVYIMRRVLMRAPKKRKGVSNYCQVCFSQGRAKSMPWAPVMIGD